MTSLRRNVFESLAISIICALCIAFVLYPAGVAQAEVSSQNIKSDNSAEMGSAVSEEPVTDETEIWDVDFVTTQNSTIVDIVIPHEGEIVDARLADTIVVTATMSYQGEVTRRIESSFTLDTSLGLDHSMDFSDYGKFSVSLSFLLDGETVQSFDDQTVGISADEYNIAPVSATLPTTFFSLNLWGDNSIRLNGPTILMMERPNAYNWDSLPQSSGSLYGVYPLPLIGKDEITYQPGDFDAASDLFRTRSDAMSAYVHDLFEINPSSRFNLYCVDYYTGLVQRLLYANGIPEDNYSITLMSDGSWSYNLFANKYGGSDAFSQNELLEEEWLASRTRAYESGAVDAEMLNWDYANQYCWAMINTEPNAEWWVARKDLLVSANDGNSFGQSVQSNSKVIQVNIASLLTSNIQSNEQSMREFEALYNFNDSYFSEAEANNKQVMLFLGTRVTGEVSFSDYARFAMSYYGNNYQYYYKGHPATPTELYPNKVDQLESLGIIDVDSSVAAELILFFNPNIFLSGYSSSTYASVPEGMAKGMFEMTKSEGLANPQYSSMDYWSTRITEASNPSILALCENGHSNYLVEFSDEIASSKGYEIAIWDATNSVISYYRLEGNSYIKVNESQGVTDQSAVKEGEYIILSSLSSGMVLDVADGSSADGANVQLYTYNGSSAQKWVVSLDEDGIATIVNSGSGKALDVQYGSVVPGSNIWQYTPNGSPAQKWRLVQNDDGTIRIVSALANDSVLDVAYGGTSNGSNIQLYSSNASAAQKFIFIPTTPDVSSEGQATLESGYYTIRTAVDTEKSLDIKDWSKSNGGGIQIWDSVEQENQTFKITALEDGFYRIESAWSGLSLDMTDGSIIPGTPVQQYASSENNLNQEWAIYDQTGGSYTIQNVATGLMLDLSGGSASNGQPVIGYTANGTQAQRWLISPTLPPDQSMDEWAKENANVLPDGSYIIASDLGNGLVLDVANASPDNGANVQLFNANFTPAQIWNVSHDEKGYVIFTNASSNKVLDVTFGEKAPGVNVQQYEANGSSAQKWIVDKQPDGSMTIISALSSTLCLDIQNGQNTAGANVQIYARNDTPSQQFSFYKLIE